MMWCSVLQKTGQGAKRIEAVLQRMFPSSSTNEKVGKMKALTEAYHNYKREYVKHLSFTTEGENLSKFILVWHFHNWFQPLCWSMPHWRQCTSTLIRQRMMRLRGMRRYRLCFTLSITCQTQSIILILTFLGEYGSPIGFNRRHYGPPHWLLHPQWSRDHLLPSKVSSIFSIFNLFKLFLSQVFHVPQKPQNRGCVCCQKEIWKSFDKEELEVKNEDIAFSVTTCTKSQYLMYQSMYH